MVEIFQKMDLHSRTVPGRWTINPEPNEGSVYEKYMVEQLFLMEKMRTLVYFLMQKRRANQRAVYF